MKDEIEKLATGLREYLEAVHVDGNRSWDKYKDEVTDRIARQIEIAVKSLSDKRVRGLIEAYTSCSSHKPCHEAAKAAAKSEADYGRLG